MSSFDRLARRLREHMDQAAADAQQGLRFKVIDTDPLTAESLESDLTLAAGDPDVEVEAWVSQYIAQYGIDVGDVLLVKQLSGGWAFVGVLEGKPVEEWTT